MIEAMLVVSLLLAMAALVLSPWLWLMKAGWVLVVVGLGVGLPAGVSYHWKLRDALVRNGPLAPRWWIHPTAQHRYLDDRARQQIDRPFRLGALGCGVALIGCAVVAIALFRSLGGPIGS